VTVAASFAATLVDEWVRAGLTDAVVAPGSRSTRLWWLSRVKAGWPCTFAWTSAQRPSSLSGSAWPPVGRQCSSRRAGPQQPKSTRLWWRLICPGCPSSCAPRTGPRSSITSALPDHRAGRAVRRGAAMAVEPGVPDEQARSSWRSLASRLVAEATAGPFGPGPVHANLAFREPLVANPGELPRAVATVDRGTGSTGSPGARPGVARGLHRARASGRKGLIVAGAGAGRPETVRRLAVTLGWPVLADPGRAPGPPARRARRVSQRPMRCSASTVSPASTCRRSSCASAGRGRRGSSPTG